MRKRPYHLLGQAALLVVIWGAIFEAGLRVQQYFGPLYDLEMASISLSWKSDVVNHRPAPEDQTMCIYGDLTGFSYKRSYDANGIRIVDDRELLAGCAHPISVLFLGDSFMEGYDDKNTLPYQVAKYFRKERGICVKSHNAGYTSYSPAIFVPQARKLLPIVRPDYIVVDVDETDLFDDFARYRPLITRNERGQNVGVNDLGGFSDVTSIGWIAGVERQSKVASTASSKASPPGSSQMVAAKADTHETVHRLVARCDGRPGVERDAGPGGGVDGDALIWGACP